MSEADYQESEERVASFPGPVVTPKPPFEPTFRIVGDPGPLFAALAQARGEFAPLKKSKHVFIRSDKGNYEFDYAPLEEVLAACMPALSANGLVLVQVVMGLEEKDLRTILGHSSGAYMESIVGLPPYKDVKGFGSALTYLRRYSVQSLLSLAADDDDDGSASNGDQISHRQTPAAPQRRQEPPKTQEAPKANRQAPARQEPAKPQQPTLPEPKPEPPPKPAEEPKAPPEPPPVQEAPKASEPPPPPSERIVVAEGDDDPISDQTQARIGTLCRVLGIKRDAAVALSLQITGKEPKGLTEGDAKKLLVELERQKDERDRA